jgi:hypothetical protein
MANARERQPLPAVRLIFEYDGDQVTLVSQQPVDIAVPGFDLAPDLKPGHYIEARSAANEPLSRVPIREAFATSAEVFPEHPGEPITRVDVAKPRGAFTVVVPAGPDAARVALLHVRPPMEVEAPLPRAATAPTPGEGEPEVVEIANFRLASRSNSEDR